MQAWRPYLKKDIELMGGVERDVGVAKHSTGASTGAPPDLRTEY